MRINPCNLRLCDTGANNIGSATKNKHEKGTLRTQITAQIDSMMQESHKDPAVPSRHYVGRTGCHIYGWSVRQCRTYLGYTRKVKLQTHIFQITTLVHLQSTVHQSMYESSVTTGHSSLTHGISPTILFRGVNHLGLVTNENARQVST